MYRIKTLYIFLLIRLKQSTSVVNTLSLKMFAKVTKTKLPQCKLWGKKNKLKTCIAESIVTGMLCSTYNKT
jgi:hypothetical protein